MSRYLVSFSQARPVQAEAAKDALRALSAVELWTGLWIVDVASDGESARECLKPVYDALLQPPHQAVGLVATRLDLDTVDIFSGIGSSLAGRLFLEDKVAPELIARQHDAERRPDVSFFGDGSARFGEFLEDFRRDFPLPATELCRSMARHGSDKALGWHSYTPFYAALLATLPGPVRSLFEIGVGSNRLDVPSNMGLDGHPGASLRAWRDYLPGAQVYGGDIDETILFAEDGIETFFVDQTRSETFDALWARLPETTFDVIIDDGLHTPDAAALTLERCLPRVRPGGVYVIEDVPVGQSDQYADRLSGFDLDGFLLRIPHPVNRYDNCLMVFGRAPS